MRNPRRIRPPAVAGLFYPADPQVLAREVDRLVTASPRPEDPVSIRALLAPHAGYRYSGALAARAFARAVRADVETIVLVGPSHVEMLGFTSVFDGDAFATPLGEVPVDRELSAALAGHDVSIRLSPRGHASGGVRGEHALEVMLPFIQRLLPGTNIVAITMGSQSRAACEALAGALCAHVDCSRTLLVASSDLSHFHSYADAVTLDTEFCARVEDMDGEALLDALERGRCEACGGGPTAAVMMACAGVPSTGARVLGRMNSGDVTGDRDSVVGYAAATFGETP